MGWQTVTTRVAYENQWISVREDQVIRPDGTAGVYGVVTTHHPAVFVVALDEQDRVVLVCIDRYTTGPNSWELPAGGSDGQDLLEAARRELAEEAGLVAASWVPVGQMWALNGIARAPQYVFVARGLSSLPGSAAHSQADEGIDAVRRIRWGEVVDMIADGRIRDGETISSLAQAAIYLGRWS